MLANKRHAANIAPIDFALFSSFFFVFVLVVVVPLSSSSVLLSPVVGFVVLDVDVVVAADA